MRQFFFTMSWSFFSFLSKVSTHWFSRSLRPVLPYPLHEVSKACVMLTKYLPSDNLFEEYYNQPHGKHHFHADLFVTKCNNSIRDIMPNADANYRYRDLLSRDFLFFFQ